uniref:Uncharacterized protein n=1 Tax=Arundo donax TaxID=35708 RepID=A0A0A9HR56_ARUDO
MGCPVLFFYRLVRCPCFATVPKFESQMFTVFIKESEQIYQNIATNVSFS